MYQTLRQSFCLVDWGNIFMVKEYNGKTHYTEILKSDVIKSNCQFTKLGLRLDFDRKFYDFLHDGYIKEAMSKFKPPPGEDERLPEELKSGLIAEAIIRLMLDKKIELLTDKSDSGIDLEIFGKNLDVKCSLGSDFILSPKYCEENFDIEVNVSQNQVNQLTIEKESNKYYKTDGFILARLCTSNNSDTCSLLIMSVLSPQELLESSRKYNKGDLILKGKTQDICNQNSYTVGLFEHILKTIKVKQYEEYVKPGHARKLFKKINKNGQSPNISNFIDKKGKFRELVEKLPTGSKPDDPPGLSTPFNISPDLIRDNAETSKNSKKNLNA
jgi:hypothetical protein